MIVLSLLLTACGSSGSGGGGSTSTPGITPSGSLGPQVVYNVDGFKLTSTGYDYNMETSGPKLSGLPSGTSYYSGRYYGYSPETDEYFASTHGGTFIMSMNFDNGNGSLHATGSTPYTHAGVTSVSDLQMTGYGTFKNSSSLMITNPNGKGALTPWTLNGEFHGSGASKVTALYKIASDGAVVVGGYVGTKQ